MCRSCLVLESSSWTRAGLDDAWVAAGWPLPEGRSVAEEVYGAAEYRFAVDDDRWVRVAMRFDPDEVVGFFFAHATYLDEHDPALFTSVAMYVAIAGVIALILSPFVKRLTGGIE